MSRVAAGNRSSAGRVLVENWVTTNTARDYGRRRRGKRLVAEVPHGRWKTATFVATVRSTGLTAPLVVDSAMNGQRILAYVKQQLAPALQPGDRVVMDNLTAPNAAGVREAIERLSHDSCIYLRTVPT